MKTAMLEYVTLAWLDLFLSPVWEKEVEIQKESEMQFTDTNSKLHTQNNQ